MHLLRPTKTKRIKVEIVYGVIDTTHKNQHSSSQKIFDELRCGDLLEHNKLEEMRLPACMKWNDDIFRIGGINYIQLIIFLI